MEELLELLETLLDPPDPPCPPTKTSAVGISYVQPANNAKTNSPTSKELMRLFMFAFRKLRVQESAELSSRCQM
jgi:hypothetical protein